MSSFTDNIESQPIYIYQQGYVIGLKKKLYDIVKILLFTALGNYLLKLRIFLQLTYAEKSIKEKK